MTTTQHTRTDHIEKIQNNYKNLNKLHHTKQYKIKYHYHNRYTNQTTLLSEISCNLQAQPNYLLFLALNNNNKYFRLKEEIPALLEED